MKLVLGFLVGLWNFLVGDDWRLAIGAVIGIALVAVAAGLGLAAWWILPVVVALTLVLSLRQTS